MKQYFTGFFTAVCLTASVFIFMGSQNKNLGDIEADSIKLTGEIGTTYLVPSGLALRNKDGNLVFIVAVGDESGGGSLRTYNVHEKMTGYFGTNKNNDGMAILFDRYGDEGWSVSGKQ